MGCPEIYYEEALRKFAYSMLIFHDKKYAEYMYNEADIKEVEDFVKKKKENLDEKSTLRFYYDAGVASCLTSQEAHDEGCDAMNASFAGLSEFEHFLDIGNG